MEELVALHTRTQAKFKPLRQGFFYEETRLPGLTRSRVSLSGDEPLLAATSEVTLERLRIESQPRLPTRLNPLQD